MLILLNDRKWCLAAIELFVHCSVCVYSHLLFLSLCGCNLSVGIIPVSAHESIFHSANKQEVWWRQMFIQFSVLQRQVWVFAVWVFLNAFYAVLCKKVILIKRHLEQTNSFWSINWNSAEEKPDLYCQCVPDSDFFQFLQRCLFRIEILTRFTSSTRVSSKLRRQESGLQTGIVRFSLEFSSFCCGTFWLSPLCECFSCGVLSQKLSHGNTQDMNAHSLFLMLDDRCNPNIWCTWCTDAVTMVLHPDRRHVKMNSPFIFVPLHWLPFLKFLSSFLSVSDSLSFSVLCPLFVIFIIFCYKTAAVLHNQLWCRFVSV